MQQEEKTLSPKHDQVREARDHRGECELILGHSPLNPFGHVFLGSNYLHVKL